MEELDPVTRRQRVIEVIARATDDELDVLEKFVSGALTQEEAKAAVEALRKR